MPSINLFIERELNQVQSEVIRQEFPEMLAASGQLLNISTELSSGAQSYTYKILTFVGSAAIIANGVQDLPLVNAYAEEREGRIRTLANAYCYTLEDFEAAQFADTNIDSQMAIGAREIVEREYDLLAYNGSAQFNLQGFINYPNVPTFTIVNDGNSNGGSSSTRWRHKTAEQIYRDMRDFVSATRIATNGVESPEAIAMPQEQFDIIVGTPYPNNSASGETILSFFMKTQRATASGVQTVFPVPYLAGKGTSGADLMISYRKRPDKIKLHMPLDFEMLPVQINDMDYKVPCRMKTGGVQVYKPLSIRYASGI